MVSDTDDDDCGAPDTDDDCEAPCGGVDDVVGVPALLMLRFMGGAAPRTIAVGKLTTKSNTACTTIDRRRGIGVVRILYGARTGRWPGAGMYRHTEHGWGFGRLGVLLLITSGR